MCDIVNITPDVFTSQHVYWCQFLGCVDSSALSMWLGWLQGCTGAKPLLQLEIFELGS